MAAKGMVAASAGALALAAAAWWLVPHGERSEAAADELAAPTRASSSAEERRALGAPATLVAEVGEPERAPVPREDAGEAARAAAPPAARERAGDAAPSPPLVLRGRVVHAQGPPAADAHVVFDELRATTDRAGRFALPLAAGHDPLDADCALVAVKLGWSPAVVPGFGARAVDAARGGEELELVLPGEAGAIEGFLLGATGAPAASADGWKIKLLDATMIAEGDFFPLTAEEVASDPTASFVLDHRRAAGAPASASRRGYEKTDAQGRFAFGGLALERTYRLRAWNERTLEVALSEPLPVGTLDAVLQVPADPPRAWVDGAVVGTDGTPLEGVRCRLTLVEHRTDSGAWMTTGQEVHTGADGRFAFHDVPHVELFVRFHGHGGEARLDLAPGEAYRDVRVVIERPGFLRYEASDPARAPDRIAVEDAGGERLRLSYSPERGKTHGRGELPVEDGRTPLATVHETAAWLVLLKDGREVGRRAVFVRPGEETVVRD
jgi:hypothetical protein